MTDEKTVVEDEKSQSSDVSSRDAKDAKENVGFKDYLRIFSHADKWDVIGMAVGALAAIASGASLAL